MNPLGAFSKLPPWALDAAFGLVEGLVKLLSADDDEGREAAMMDAAETMKAALDRKKFGP
jgi:hypothetical protein